jgi:hypothetical protein
LHGLHFNLFSALGWISFPMAVNAAASALLSPSLLLPLYAAAHAVDHCKQTPTHPFHSESSQLL